MINQDKDSQPDSGGNRHYDYLDFNFDAVRKALKNKKSWSELTTEDIVILRHDCKDKYSLDKDVVDHRDRLALLRCLFYHCDSRDRWMTKARELEKKHIERLEKDLKK